MATPTWVGFDAAPQSRDELLEAADRLIRGHDFQLVQVSDLVSGNEGMEVGATEVDCRSLEEAFSLARDWQGLVLSYSAPALGGKIHTYSWRESGAPAFGLEIPHMAPVYGEPEGFWLQEFLCDMADAVEARLCIYSADQPVLERARLDDVPARLRLGNIFRFLLVERHQLTAEQLAELQDLTRGMTYFPVGEAYHVWSRLVRV